MKRISLPKLLTTTAVFALFFFTFMTAFTDTDCADAATNT